MIENTIERTSVELTKEDFVSDQMVKWCPGCGSHAILSSIEKVFPKIGYRKENFMVVPQCFVKVQIIFFGKFIGILKNFLTS